ncbi:MAG: anti-sigma factor [Actinomycetota bacterium]|nr:anti-sigma factor [Actinomycetota bacterium]
MSDEDTTCAEVVELVSDYLDGNLPEQEAQRVADHLAGCPGCTAYFEQVRATSAGLGRVTTDNLPPDVRTSLLEAFRKSRHSPR